MIIRPNVYCYLYITFILLVFTVAKKKIEEGQNALRKEVIALQIMLANYEQMVKAQQISMGHVETELLDEEKFQLVIISVLNRYKYIFFFLKFNLCV